MLFKSPIIAQSGSNGSLVSLYKNTFKSQPIWITVFRSLAFSGKGKSHEFHLLVTLLLLICNCNFCGNCCNYSSPITITITFTENSVTITANYNYISPLPQHWCTYNILLLFLADKITVSANSVCNAMVHNPIYDGPVYESVQRQFDTLTSTTLRAAQTSDSDTSLNQHCSSQLSTPTSSEKSVRYVEQPVQPPKPRSKSFASNDHSHTSISACAAAIVPRSTSVSVPAVTKKAAKQRNKFNLTLTLNGNVPSDLVATQTCGPISGVNRVVLRDEEDNYTVMSPFDRGSKWNELSPEDTDKYKE